MIDSHTPIHLPNERAMAMILSGISRGKKGEQPAAAHGQADKGGDNRSSITERLVKKSRDSSSRHMVTRSYATAGCCYCCSLLLLLL